MQTEPEAGDAGEVSYGGKGFPCGRAPVSADPFERDTPQRPGFGERPAGVLGPAAVAAPAGPPLAGAFGAPPATRRRVPPRAMRGLLAAFILLGKVAPGLLLGTLDDVVDHVVDVDA